MSPTPKPGVFDLPARILDRIAFEPSSGCWLWSGHVTAKGYGVAWYNGSMRKAHRVVYDMLGHRVENGMQTDHLCRQRCCVNPDHLEVVDGRTNTLRGIGLTAANARLTHCVNGHPFTAENTVKHSDGCRRCRICQLAAQRRHYWRTRP